MESALFPRFKENFQPTWVFWQLWRSQMRFGQNLFRMTWKERFVQFSWKANCFSVLKGIWGQFHDFENFDAPKCNLGKTCSAWPEKSVLYSFHRKRTVFPFWAEFQARMTVLKTLTLTNAIWPQRAAHDLKRAFCTIFMVNAPFSRFEETLRLVWRLWKLWRSKMRFGQNVLRMTCKERFVLFSWRATVFPFSREFEASSTILRTLTLKNAIWPKRAPHDLKRAFCTIFMETALFSRFQENFRPVWRFWELWRSKMRFGQNVLRMTWKERFVQFSWKAHCFPVLKRILGWCDDFENFDALKCDLAKTCCAWPEKCVLKSTVFPFWREFEVSFTILRTFTLQNAIWPKRAPHDLKRACCTIFMESALFSLFGENLRPVSRFWEPWRSKMQIGQNVLRMTIMMSWKGHCFPVLKRIGGHDDFENFDAPKCDLAITCCAWPEKCVLYNFHGKRTVSPF